MYMGRVVGKHFMSLLQWWGNYLSCDRQWLANTREEKYWQFDKLGLKKHAQDTSCDFHSVFLKEPLDEQGGRHLDGWPTRPKGQTALRTFMPVTFPHCVGQILSRYWLAQAMVLSWWSQRATRGGWKAERENGGKHPCSSGCWKQRRQQVKGKYSEQHKS